MKEEEKRNPGLCPMPAVSDFGVVHVPRLGRDATWGPAPEAPEPEPPPQPAPSP